MKCDKDGIYFSWAGFAAACLAVSAVLGAFVVMCLNLGSYLSYFVSFCVVFVLVGAAVAFLMETGAALYNFFLHRGRLGRGWKLLFWCLYPAMLLVLMALLAMHLPNSLLFY